MPVSFVARIGWRSSPRNPGKAFVLATKSNCEAAPDYATA